MSGPEQTDDASEGGLLALVKALQRLEERLDALCEPADAYAPVEAALRSGGALEDADSRLNGPLSALRRALNAEADLREDGPWLRPSS